MTHITPLAMRLFGDLAVHAARLFLPSWLFGAASTDTHGTSRWASFRDLRRLGRVADPRAMHGDGIVLGWFHNRLVQAPAEDSVVLFGAQRSGKTSTVVVPTLLAWRGAAVATSTKEELVALTSRHRSTIGRAYVFAPLDRDQSWIGRLGLKPATWNPVDAADSCGAAAELADHFTASGKQGQSAHWYLAASTSPDRGWLGSSSRWLWRSNASAASEDRLSACHRKPASPRAEQISRRL